ncbi:hypothetical protein AB0B04_19570 [Streptomyces xinghaiensis]|uniref:Uncharacterized protein n=2 Tax=Streptomyces TaxID=1883 RepID=A0A3R7LKZ2_9ACTN|nr:MULTISPECIES: hypothetical protein [Streptomyces]KNE83375.1 hypothetical protein ADZ36_06050 [Streptomyces fradiae]OFA37589.1 hypothetical protein BEN35_28930 [Streptomyces fradiae]PQM20534.1 hypothetical protein Sfr7A_25360 [Streptomyces xinghaiensis]RKM92476.1 hypothetical protein SFRA_024015 [Streptomyces xinghaiensis]RNC70443.1 hypothetical protein DC095_025005 [Streptomyces xinghaiensis]
MNSNDPNHSPLRDVAQNPEATAQYLADVQRVLLDIGKNLETLAQEVRIHCRDTHVEGDRFYDAWLRAQPVEKAFKDVLKNVEAVTKGLEKGAYKRRAHDEAVANTARKRKEKELERQRKKNPQLLQAAPNPPQQSAQGKNLGYADPTSIFDLGNRESA